MIPILQHIRRLDWILIFSSVCLVGIGLVSLYSSSGARGDFANFEKQIVFFIIGIACMFMISAFDYRLLRNNSLFILVLYGIGIVALAGLFLFAPEIRGIQGWYRISGISVDPVEFVKLVLVILMAKYFASRHREVYRIRHILLTGLYFVIPMILIALQPDLGPAFLLALVWGVLLIVAGIRFRHIIVMVTVGVLIVALGWSFFLLDHQKDRIFSFLEPELDPLGIGWSQLQAKIAIGNGGIFGQGIGEGTQTQYGFLSEPQTDFIFAAIAEEMGFVGVFMVLAMLMLFIGRVLRIGVAVQENFALLFVIGFGVLVMVQAAINIGMNVGLLPIIGLSLPFVSYGGSNLIFTYIGLGFLLSIISHR